jgi:hypothetical protein
MFGAKASLHSRREYEETDERAYEAVHPINQETLLLGADLLHCCMKGRVHVWRSWREEIRPAQTHSSLLCCHQHSSFDCQRDTTFFSIAC